MVLSQRPKRSESRLIVVGPLLLIEPLVDIIGEEEVRLSPTSDDPPVFKHYHTVRLLEGRESVGNDDGSTGSE